MLCLFMWVQEHQMYIQSYLYYRRSILNSEQHIVRIFDFPPKPKFLTRMLIEWFDSSISYDMRM